jgi:integrase/recombinase XerC
MRLAELCGLNFSDIDLHREVAKVRGKGRRERLVPLGRSAINALRRYLFLRPTNTNALFVSRKRNRLSPRTVQDVMHRFLDEFAQP